MSSEGISSVQELPASPEIESETMDGLRFKTDLGSDEVAGSFRFSRRSVRGRGG